MNSKFISRHFIAFFAFSTLLFATLANAQIITTVAGSGVIGYSGDGGAATAATLSTPAGITFDTAGNMYIADHDNHVIRKVNSSGIISTIAGTGTAGYSGNGGPATAAMISRPADIIFDGGGNLFFTEFTNHTIRKISPSGTISLYAGVPGMGLYSVDGLPATNAGIGRPFGLAFDAAGNMYIAAQGNHRILKVNSSGIVNSIAGDGTAGYSGDGMSATAAKFNMPTGICFDGSGNLYVADQLNHRIRKIDATGIVSTVAGNGTPGYSGDGGAATAANFDQPIDVALDGSGNIFVADVFNYAIRKVAITSGIISTISGTGVYGFSGDGGPATAATLGNPQGISFSVAGDLFLTDVNNQRVRKITAVGTPLNIKVMGFPSSSLSLIPNPNNGTFIIKGSLQATTAKNVPVTVTDILGKVIYETTATLRNGEVEALITISEDTPKGIYLLHIRSETGHMVTRFIVDK